MAVNCLSVPLAMLGLGGVMAMLTSVALVTVRRRPWLTLPSAAVMVVVPGVRPWRALGYPGREPGALLIVATAPLFEPHVTWVVMSCVVASV